jgi:uncharacterized protein (TIGR00297 family)
MSRHRQGRLPGAPAAAAPSGHSETARQASHIAFGAAALLLPYLHWYQSVILAAAAVVFNIRVLKWMTRTRVHRPIELNQRLPAGLVLYPTSILLLLLMFPSRCDIVAAAWGILAAGDGAATLVGTRYGRRAWSWNGRKTVAGSAALVAAGGAAGALLAWWCRPAVVPPPYVWFSVGAPFAAAIAAAAVETAPIRLDDNVSIPIAAAAVLWTLSMVSADLVRTSAQALPALLAVALPANAALAAAGYAAGTVSASGATAGVIIGSAVFVSAGWRGWLLLLVAFALAVIASRLGLQRKTLLGIAQEDGGRRGAGQALANTGVAAVAALLSVLSYAQASALVAFAAALTAGASDTVASEIGKGWGRRTWAILPLRPAAPGTPGAVSIEGTAAGLVAAAGLGSLAIALGLVPAGALAAIVVGATAGSLVESLLAATFEPAGILNNDALNLINTSIAAFTAVSLAGVGG